MNLSNFIDLFSAFFGYSLPFDSGERPARFRPERRTIPKDAESPFPSPLLLKSPETLSFPRGIVLHPGGNLDTANAGKCGCRLSMKKTELHKNRPHVAQGAARCNRTMKIRHEGLRSLHEQDAPARLRANPAPFAATSVTTPTGALREGYPSRSPSSRRTSRRPGPGASHGGRPKSR